ncbi:MAG: hypothetical protein Q9157_006818 [Trypethelium eluteriae]
MTTTAPTPTPIPTAAPVERCELDAVPTAEEAFEASVFGAAVTPDPEAEGVTVEAIAAPVLDAEAVVRIVGVYDRTGETVARAILGPEVLLRKA